MDCGDRWCRFVTEPTASRTAKLKDLLLSQVTVSFPTNADEATALVQPTLADRTLIDPVLTERQRKRDRRVYEPKGWSWLEAR